MHSVTSALLVTVMVLLPGIVSAQTGSQFETDLTIIGADVTPPSVPTGLTTNAVSTSQINLSWSASTDDVAVTGYNIFRDAGFVASTTGTSYSDTGLATSTSYAYTVSAFDAAGNESARSATSSATTQAPAPPSTSSGGGGGPITTPDPTIGEVQITSSTTFVTLTWTTNIPTRARLSWGKSIDLEQGTILIVDYTTLQTLTLDNLDPESVYYYQLIVETTSGKTAQTQGQFVTQSLPDTTAPANPTDFTAQPLGSSIALNWTNPDENDFDSVRIVRSDKFYPTDIYDGQVLYEGSNETFMDNQVVPNTTYYYTLFAKDTKENYSSGAIASARIVSFTPPTTSSSGGTGGGSTGKPTRPGTTSPGIDVPIIEAPHPDIASLALIDFVFEQEGRRIPSSANGTVILDGGKTTSIYLDVDRLPLVLKTISVTVWSPQGNNRSFSFLMRTNEEKTIYSGAFGSLREKGTYPFEITVIDFLNQGLKRLNGTFIVESRDVSTPNVASHPIISFIFDRMWWILGLFLGLLLLWFFLIAWKRRKEEEEEEKTELYTIHHQAR